MDINIVLHEPEIPQNTGNIARTCSATGTSLHLIEPFGFKIDDSKLKRAGLDYWHTLDISHYKNMEDFLRKNPDADFYCCTTKAKKSYTEITYPKKVFLIFGKETAGLPEQFLSAHSSKCIRIPMLPNQRSLNLSNAAAIILYEVLRQRNFSSLV